MKRVVIAGGGIIGASLAWHLTRRAGAAEVILVEKARPAAGTTKDSFAWINATFSKQPRHYFELNRMGIAAWRRLEREMTAPPPIQWGGSVEWYGEGPKAEELRKSVAQHRQWGYATRLADEQEVRRLIPEIDPGGSWLHPTERRRAWSTRWQPPKRSSPSRGQPSTILVKSPASHSRTATCGQRPCCSTLTRCVPTA